MSSVNDQDGISQITRVLQIIVVALVAGLVMFLGVVVVMRQASPPKPQGGIAPPSPILAYLAYAIAAGGLAASILVPKLITDSQRRSIARGTWKPQQTSQGAWLNPFGDAMRLASVYQNQKIIGAALNEGPAFFALIVYLLSGETIVLLVTLGLIAGVAARFPTQSGVERWIEVQLERLNLERQFGE
jgi:hypothetical protein